MNFLLHCCRCPWSLHLHRKKNMWRMCKFLKICFFFCNASSSVAWDDNRSSTSLSLYLNISNTVCNPWVMGIHKIWWSRGPIGNPSQPHGHHFRDLRLSAYAFKWWIKKTWVLWALGYKNGTFIATERSCTWLHRITTDEKQQAMAYNELAWRHDLFGHFY